LTYTPANAKAFAGLAASGSQGVTEMVDMLTAEQQRIMSVTGCRRVSDIDSGILVARHHFIGR
jgi:isopentenyl diphosphate isomerase/L-lactate dehydrogenase-like FMN-dependent dehydrogenase